MPKNTDTIGNISVAKILVTLITDGREILIPFGEHCRYDLAEDRDGCLIRIQCKTGRLRNGAILFSNESGYYNYAKEYSRRAYTKEEIDCYGVYCPETDSVYLIPFEDAQAIGQVSLRVEAPKNGQSKGIRWAKDFLITPP